MATKTLSAVKTATMGKQISGTWNGWNGYDDHLQVGATPNYKWRALIRFPLWEMPEYTKINSATLRLTYYSTETVHSVMDGTLSSNLKIGRMTKDWGKGSTNPGEGNLTANETWKWDNRYNQFTQAKVSGPRDQTTTGALCDVDLTDITKAWLDNGKANFGIILINDTSETDDARAFLFYATDSANAQGLWPELVIDYDTNNAPTVATSLDPVDAVTVDTLTPTFSWSFNDADVGSGDYMRAWRLRVWRTDDATDPVTGIGVTPVWDSGIVYTSNQPIEGSTVYGEHDELNKGVLALQPGVSYEWHVRTYDRHMAASSYTTAISFTTNAVPNAPQISVAPLPLTGVPDNTPNITITHTDPDPDDNEMHGYQIIVEQETSLGAGDWVTEWDTGAVDTSGAPVITVEQTTTTLDWGGSFRAKARTQDQYGAWGPFSTWRYFQVAGTAVPVNLNPANSEVAGTTPILTGQRGSTLDVITQVTLEVLSDDLGTTLLTATNYTSGITSGQTFSITYAGSALTSGNGYQWRAKVRSNGIDSEWSAFQRFVVSDGTEPAVTSPLGDGQTLTPTVTITRGTNFNRTQWEVYPESSTSSSLGTAHYTDDTSHALGGSHSETYAGTALEWDTGYKIRARVSSDSGTNWSSWSGLYHFRTDSAEAPTLTSVGGITANPAWITDPSPDFVIARGGSDTIDQAQVRIFSSVDSSNPEWDSGMTDVTNSTTATLTYDGPGLTRGEMYGWEARYQDATGVVGPWSQRKNFSLNAWPSVATQMEPESGQVIDASATKVFRAFFYDPDVSVYGDFPDNWEITVLEDDDTPVDTKTITAPVNGINEYTWTTPALTAGGYKWKTRFQDSKSEWGAMSAEVGFVVATAPNGTLTTPSAGTTNTTVTTVTPSVQWNTTLATQASYTLAIDEVASDGSYIESVTVLDGSTETSINIPAGYLKDTKYYQFKLTVRSTEGLDDPTPSTASVRVLLDAPNPVTGLEAVAYDEWSVIRLTWDANVLKANHTFRRYQIERRLYGYEDWETIGSVNGLNNTSYSDWYAGHSLNYEYAVRAITNKTGANIDLESGDDPDGGSKQISQIASDEWTFVGADRAVGHISNLMVISEDHNRPIQQEVFETLGNDRKVIMRGFVLGHEGSLTTLWVNEDVPLPEDEQTTINSTLQGRRIVDYLTRYAGPHIVKSPFGDVWDAEFSSPNYTWLPTGHLEVKLEWVETGRTSREMF